MYRYRLIYTRIESSAGKSRELERNQHMNIWNKVRPREGWYQWIMTHCNTLQRTAAHCATRQARRRRRHDAVQLTATHSNTLQHAATHCNTLQYSAAQKKLDLERLKDNMRQWHTAMHCNELQHTATHCNTQQHTATFWHALHYSALHYNALQHIAHCSTPATHCNTPHHQASEARSAWKEFDHDSVLLDKTHVKMMIVDLSVADCSSAAVERILSQVWI